MDEQQQYNRKLISLLNKKERQVRQLYYDAIVELAGLAATLPYKQTIFNLSLYPLLRRRVDYLLRDMAKKMEVVIVNGIDQAWQLSDDKNRVFLDKRLKGYKLSNKARKTYYDTNAQAKTTFKSRQENGLNLSERVWNAVEPFKRELELGLSAGIARGESAATMATRMKRNLKEPDRIFRSVVDKDGRIRLSKAARNYHPGQGVYRSSYKNALRLTRTENNMAYRTADYERWDSQPFVVGIEIRLSNAHPKYDICDPLAGKYPKGFKWTGWHPQCICYQTPILITREEMDKHQDEILGLAKWDGKSVNQVNDAPAAFYKYLDNNDEKINRLSNAPYWVKDNPSFTTALK
ncbi:hypothetical protein [Chitinophaga japonensis]|uniref:Phage Mu protein F like protein n=1 Tax=Chitinophaga japonensis TaxID=104662 RepID=A0A562SY62_CHIJA|nr:hypothetical protein [Chitinophaga japonensis]TWI86305.1 hypothetical protein LX66_3559 [Chitinophaga japonensis]